MMNKAAASGKKIGELFREDAESSIWPAEMCKRLIESSPWPMFVLDCETAAVLEVNDAAIRKYGHSRRAFLEHGVQEVIPDEYQGELRGMLSQGLNGPVRDYEVEHRLADGTRVLVEITSCPVVWNGRAARFSIARDSRNQISRRSQDQASSTPPPPISIPDATPLVPGTAAHDFNNLLTVILAVAEQMQEGEGDPEQQAELIAKTVRNAQDLAQQRLQLSYQQQSRREQIQLNAVLSEQGDVLAAVLGREIALEMDFDADLWPVFADAMQWREVVLNLAMNARDAMPQGGLLEVRTLAYNGSVAIEVTDTGAGISPENLQRIFDPFFTTKATGRGTGLGLSVSYGIIKEHAGKVDVRSTPGKGTSFRLEFPVARKPVHA
jgi:two-component system, cell cycle sensor histidine kinase and response regulator CckA